MTNRSQSGAGAISNNKGLQVLQAQHVDSGGGHHQILQGSAGCGIRACTCRPAAVQVEYIIQQMKHEGFIQQKGNVLRIS